MSSTPISIPRSGTRSPAAVRSSARLAWAAFRRNPLTLVGLVIVAGFVVVAATAPFVAIENPLVQDLPRRLSAPSAAHPFGLDSLGRDVLCRVVYGARISVVSGVAVVAAALLFGVAAEIGRAHV